MRAAVRGLSFAVGPGETLAIVGESGCGKSLTAFALLGLLPANARADGRVRLEGRDILGLRGEAMRALRGARIAMIFQEPMTALNPVLTIGAQIVEAIRAHEPVTRDFLVQAPAHPYIRALFASVPSIERRSHRAKTAPADELPSPYAPPSGCHFHPRCPLAVARCRSETPILRDVAEADHRVACHLV